MEILLIGGAQLIGLGAFLIWAHFDKRKHRRETLKRFRDFKRVLDETYWSETPPDWVHKPYTMDNLSGDITNIQKWDRALTKDEIDRVFKGEIVK